MGENENNTIVKVDVRQIAKGEDIDIKTFDGKIIMANVKALQTLLPGTAQGTPFELAAFLAYCQTKQLDPFSKQVYFIKYSSSDPPAWVVSWEVFMARAARHPQFDGMEAGIIWNVDGTIERGQPCDYPEDAHHEIVGGWARVHRKDRKVPTHVEVPLTEMEKHKRDGAPTVMWRGQKTTMCVKVPKARALRQAFADDLGGLYTDAEPIVEAPDSSDASADVPTREERKEQPLAEPEATPQEAVVNVILGELTSKMPLLGGADSAAIALELLPQLARTTMEDGDTDWSQADNWTPEVCEKVMDAVAKFGVPDDLLPEPKDNGNVNPEPAGTTEGD